MKKWLDKYDAPKAQNGIEGTMGGLTDIGFNYNGAWGGTMQDGGYIDSVLNANKNLDWVQRLYEKNTPSIKIPGQKGRSTHFMESADGRVYPTVVRMPNGKLKYLADKAYDYADSTKTYIQFPSDEAAKQFGENYKKGTGVLKNFAMGGGIPGAVGFTYARTGSIPSNGPYAKKTKASAQKGKAITKREDFEPWWNWASRKAGDVDERQDAFGTLGDLYAYYAGQPLRYNVLENSEYKPTNAKDPNAKYISINDPKFKQEVFDKYNDVFIKKELGKGKLQAQKINDNTYSVSGYTPATRKQFEESKKLGTHPVYMKGKDYVSNAIGRYFISKGKDEKGDYISYYDTFDEGSGPDGGGIGEMLKLTKPFEIYDRIYLDPKTGKPKMQDGGLMKYYQEGLDFKPKTISQDGAVIDPMGYWNPENVGNPVIIPSNVITMEGVDQPLIGISDTGDVQYMEPGEDYEFDGEYVTEYPVAQNGTKTLPNVTVKGKRKPIIVSDPKDPRLKAYQDSLSLYNNSIAATKLYNDISTSSKTDEEYTQRVGFGPTGYGGENMPDTEFNKLGQKINEVLRKHPNWKPITRNQLPVSTYADGIKRHHLTTFQFKKPEQPVEYKKPEQEKDKFGLTKEDYIQARKNKFVKTPGSDKGDGYYELKKDGKSYKVYTQSGGNSWVDKIDNKPKSKPVIKPEPKKEQPKSVEKKQNIYEGTPVYSAIVGSGGPSALVGFVNQKGDTTYIKPEDYERFGVPKYGKEFIESKKKKMKNGGGVSVNNADAQPLKKLDQLLNFTNYNKPTKGGWLDKYN